ncbi:MAG TPA: CRTAC1 family protein [Polyangiaceae bacterium]|nr:CRTAC1 family protein [Polyangiaceae bacterium]
MLLKRSGFAVGCLLATACGWDPAPAEGKAPLQPGEPPDRGVVFTDASGRLKSHIRNSNLPFPNNELGLGGAAWFDFDTDGDLDLFLPNGKAGKNSLFQNDGKGGFKEVGARAKVNDGIGHSGVVAGDLNNDGYPDLVLLGEGNMVFAKQTPSVIYMNNGDGTFRDISETANLPGGKTGLSAALADINNDGFLDVFWGSPGHLDPSEAVGLEPGTVGGVGRQDDNVFYLSNGVDDDGNVSFTDITESAGIKEALATCAVGFYDYNDDTFQDLFLANCHDKDFLPSRFVIYRNNGDLTFSDTTEQFGISPTGYFMGITFADYDGDSDIDIFATNLGKPNFDPLQEVGVTDLSVFEHLLLIREGEQFVSRWTDWAPADLLFGWGTTSADFDNDGFVDLYFQGTSPFNSFIGAEWGNPGYLFYSEGHRFREAERGTFGPNLSERYTSGAAQADIDLDGFADLVVVAESQLLEKPDPGHPVLLVNDGNRNRSLTVKLRGTSGNSDAIGATVYAFPVELDGPTPLVDALAAHAPQVRLVQAGSSLASSESLWPSFGLGSGAGAWLLVVWPSGVREYFGRVEAGKVAELVEDAGEWSSRQ